MKIEKPVFIIGSGRSGTTVLYNVLALHPDLCWFSNLTERYPHIRPLPLVHRLVDMPVTGHLLKDRITKRITPSLRPNEGDTIYHTYCGFENKRPMNEDELTPIMEERFKQIIRNHLRFTGKPRFLSKQTANSQRIRVIHKMFPDAYYIHIIRDGRAVANSLFKVRWWRDIDIWWLGGKPAKWEAMNREPIELCALHWKRDVTEILTNKHLFADRYLEIRYEDLVQDAPGIMRRILHFCELPESAVFQRAIPGNLVNMNYKWDKNLTERQKAVVNESIGDLLLQLGYGV